MGLAVVHGIIKSHNGHLTVHSEEGKGTSVHVYLPMAERVMRRIVEDLGHRHPCRWVRVTHRVGVVPVGEAAIQVAVTAAHRAAAFALVTRFMDRLKQDVPIWKRRALAPAELEALRP